MSAWSTNGRHNAIVADALIACKIVTGTKPEQIYTALALANDRSVHADHNDRLAGAEAERYGYVPGGDVTPPQVMGLTASYYHQSCEHDSYEGSPVQHCIDGLMVVIEARHSITIDDITYGTEPGQGAWSISDLSERDNGAWLEIHARMYPELDAQIIRLQDAFIAADRRAALDN